MSEILIEPRHELSAAQVEVLEDALYEFNRRQTGYHDGLGLAFEARREGALAGAVAGYTWGGICELRQVIVEEAFRGEGIGRALVQAALSEAVRRGCRRVFLTTYDFQAPEFYRKLGFEAVA